MSVSTDLGMLYLPQDIIKEILSRLPAKSVGRFRCVSKSWLHLTTHPDFIDSHLKQQKQKLLYSAGRSLFTLDYEGGQDMVPLELDFPLRNPHLPYLVGAVDMFWSCNGLICIRPQPPTFFVFNPCTGESLSIPHFQVPSFLHSSSTLSYSKAHSFGYAPSIKDYKFVMIEQRAVFAFSLKTKSWKRVQDFPYAYVSGDLGAPLNGAIHWLCTNPGGHPVIVALDLAEEKFSELPTPESITDFQKYKTGVLRGCLCLLERNQRNWPCSFWVMEEFGVKESWSRIVISADPRTCLALRPLCYMKNNNMVLLLINGMELILGNPKNGSCVDYVKGGFLGVVYDHDLYAESLVSPNISEKKCSCV